MLGACMKASKLLRALQPPRQCRFNLNQVKLLHYLELYITQNIISNVALEALPILPVMVELNTTPTIEELSKATDHLSCRKAPGKDGIPLEVITEAPTRTLMPLMGKLIIFRKTCVTLTS